MTTPKRSVEVLEAWEPIKFIPKYMVSSMGRIRNVKTGRILKQAITWRGYPRICLRLGDLSKKYAYVHRLVAEAFIRPIKPDEQVNHLDFNKTNNWAWNLEYVTRRENLEHAWANGRKRQGDSHGMRKLNSTEVGEIRQLASSGIAKRELAKTYGVCKAQIVKIVAGLAWKHRSLKGPEK